MQLFLLLLLSPAVIAFLVLITPSQKFRFGFVTLNLLILWTLTYFLVQEPTEMLFYFAQPLKQLIIIADVLLLLYFLWQGKQFKHMLVALLALSQLLLYLYIESTLSHTAHPDLLIDQLSKTMFLIINIVGSVIILYAVKYIASEPVSDLKKRLFILYLLLFLPIMNLIVAANDLLLFFFLFEMTTLASYLLIAYRADETSRANALKALWMNQIGGIVILIGALIFIRTLHTTYFDTIAALQGGGLLFGIAFVSMAALVKGASIPFDRWLIGAMVAPTPVSAMLHSATMVKIAPYMIIKFAPLIAGTLLGDSILILGGFIFATASYLALAKDQLKEVLGYSTIALLALMMSMAALGTQQALFIATVLMLFHALSKALLFLSAGVVEKLHHAKSIGQMKGLVSQNPVIVTFLLIGFISLSLPPFGLFMGKLLALEHLTELLSLKPYLILPLLTLIIGSAIMVLLYFKIASALLQHNETRQETVASLGFTYTLTLSVLALLLAALTLWFFSIYRAGSLYYLALPLLLLLFLPWVKYRLERFDKSRTYHCGEVNNFNAALLYFSPPQSLSRLIPLLFTLGFAFIAVSGGLS